MSNIYKERVSSTFLFLPQHSPFSIDILPHRTTKRTVANMHFTGTALSLLLALPLALANPCASGEIGIGYTVFTSIGTEPGGPGPTHVDSTIFADNCETLDNAADSSNFCTASWSDGYGAACYENDALSVGVPGQLYFPCYKPSGNGLCGNFPFGHAQVFFCCQKLG